MNTTYHKKYICLLASTLVLLTLRVSAQQPGFVQDDIIKTAGITTDNQVYPLTVTQKQTTRIYYDGLGRPIQSVAMQASPAGMDMIQPVVYDNLGRQTKTYLPYADETSGNTDGRYRSNAVSTGQPAFYSNTTQYLVATDNSPFAQQVFENSPLQRLLNAGMVGNGYQPTGGTGTQYYKTASYRSNSSADGNILIWNPDGTFTAGNYYTTGSLSVTDAKDEDNVETLSFTDLEGHLILKRQLLTSGNADTYYIYNNAGMIRYIVPPNAVDLLAANSYNLTVAPLSNIVFKFTYDNVRGRLIEKTVPGKGTMYIVYDPLNRPVLMQDANMLGNNQWAYVKYDNQGRVASQGIYTDVTSGHNGRANMQTYVNGLAANYNTNWYESRTGTLTTGYYTNVVFPTGSAGTLTPLAYAYYDNYDLNNDGIADVNYQSDPAFPGQAPTTAPLKGVPTMLSKTTVGAGFAANTWLFTVTFFDKRGNPIQVRSNNPLYYTGATTLTDISTTMPDFMGMPHIIKVAKQTSASVTTTVQTNISYDAQYRVTGITQNYNGSTTAIPVSAYAYNELGQLIKKGLGGTGTPIQNVNFRYNIRGQLAYINNSTLTNDGGVTSGDSNDVFGMQMIYGDSDPALGSSPYHDGKLWAVKWMSRNADGVTTTNERSYKYAYDGLNRYTGEAYGERLAGATPTTPFSTNADAFDETITQYDKAGNIMRLNRNGLNASNANVQIDLLTYTNDTTNPDRLLTVTDGTGANYTGAGFRNITGSTSPYQYDANGNLVADNYKGLTTGAFNVLNQVNTITIAGGGYINYSYNADGTLIRKQQYNSSGALQTTTDYIDGFVFVNNTLSYFAMPEGRVTNNTGTLSQEYIITDQQGNARISFNNTGSSGAAKVIQENSYYGFGLQLQGSPVTPPAVPNKQLYNGGSEWQNDLANNLPDYYQTYYRNYDAAIGRFVGVDPEAESAESMTSYQYAGNDPTNGNDPIGDVTFSRGSGGVTPGGAKPGGNTLSNFWFPDGSVLVIEDGFEVDYDVSSDGTIRTRGKASTVVDINLPNLEEIYKYEYITNVGQGGGVVAQRDSPVNSDDNNNDDVANTNRSVININMPNIGIPNLGSPILSNNIPNIDVTVNPQTGTGTKDNGNPKVGDIGFGLTGVTLDAFSKTGSSLGIYTQKIGFHYYGTGWGGDQYVKTVRFGPVFGGLSTALSVYTTYKAFSDIKNGDRSPLTISDAAVGTTGLGAQIFSYFSGVEVPYVGEGVAIYGLARTSWDIGTIVIKPGIEEYEESAKKEGCNICLLAH
jgi:RHS repeat-associated protein